MWEEEEYNEILSNRSLETSTRRGKSPVSLRPHSCFPSGCCRANASSPSGWQVWCKPWSFHHCIWHELGSLPETHSSQQGPGLRSLQRRAPANYVQGSNGPLSPKTPLKGAGAGTSAPSVIG